jgi:hypothetical protein
MEEAIKNFLKMVYRGVYISRKGYFKLFLELSLGKSEKT